MSRAFPEQGRGVMTASKITPRIEASPLCFLFPRCNDLLTWGTIARWTGSLAVSARFLESMIGWQPSTERPLLACPSKIEPGSIRFSGGMTAFVLKEKENPMRTNKRPWCRTVRIGDFALPESTTCSRRSIHKATGRIIVGKPSDRDGSKPEEEKWAQSPDRFLA